MAASELASGGAAEDPAGYDSLLLLVPPGHKSLGCVAENASKVERRDRRISHSSSNLM